MKPSGAGFVGHVHVRSSSTFCATATHGPPMDRHLAAVRERIVPPAEDRRRARELRRGLPRV